jgi:hypothetical protein
VEVLEKKEDTTKNSWPNFNFYLLTKYIMHGICFTTSEFTSLDKSCSSILVKTKALLEKAFFTIYGPL